MSESTEPTVELEVFEHYREGYPMLAAVTLRNPNPKRTYFTIPELDHLVVPGPLELVVTTPAGAEITLEAETGGAAEGEPQGVRMGPGGSRRVLVDLSERLVDAAPGTYRVRPRYVMRPLTAEGPGVPFVVDAAEQDEREAAAALRTRNADRAPSWNAFVVSNCRTIEADELADIGEAGHTALAYHLFLHQAVYAPIGIARLDPDVVDAFAIGPLAAEARAVRHELLAARGDATAAAVAGDIRQRWPGLAWRVENNETGVGLLRTLRTAIGAERSFPPLPTPAPYTESTAP